MSKSPTYYFSTGSRYAYLSMSQMPALEQRTGVQFDWVPVNGKRIRALRGVDPFQGPPQSGQYDWAYRKRDAKAWARLYGVAFQEPEDVEFDVELLLRAVLSAQQMGNLRDYAWALAEQVFALGQWPLDDAVVEAVARQQGLDIEAFNALRRDPSTQQKLVDNCAEAVARGVFGTPSWVVGEDLFWGNDRLVLVEQRLTEKQSDKAIITPVGLDHVVLRSANPQRLVEFYSGLFATSVERTVGDSLWQLRIGDSLLDIIAAKGGSDATPERLRHGANMDHFCVRIASYDEEKILKHLSANGVDASATGKIYGAQGFGPSIYLFDPDGNRVELKQHKIR